MSLNLDLLAAIALAKTALVIEQACGPISAGDATAVEAHLKRIAALNSAWQAVLTQMQRSCTHLVRHPAKPELATAMCSLCWAEVPVPATVRPTKLSRERTDRFHQFALFDSI